MLSIQLLNFLRQSIGVFDVFNSSHDAKLWRECGQLSKNEIYMWDIHTLNLFFLSKTPNGILGTAFCPIVIGSGVVVVVRNKVRQSFVLRTVWLRIIKFYRNLHTRRVYNHTGYDVTKYFRSEATAKNCENADAQTASGLISEERLMRGSPNFWHGCQR